MKPPVSAVAAVDVIAADDIAIFAGALPALSTRDLVIRLRFEESLPFPEIAARLGVTRALVYKIAKDERLRRRAHGANGDRNADDNAESDSLNSPVTQSLGCRVCGVVPTAPAKLRANGLCRRHAHRLEKYGDAEIELRGDRPAVCESCGKGCGSDKSREGSRASGRVRGADGRYRCQSCAWREDEGFRARHQALTKRWRERTRGKRILNDALSALSSSAAARKITYAELSEAAVELNAARERLR